jgi:hypothetical protein
MPPAPAHQALKRQAHRLGAPRLQQHASLWQNQSLLPPPQRRQQGLGLAARPRS